MKFEIPPLKTLTIFSLLLLFWLVNGIAQTNQINKITCSVEMGNSLFAGTYYGLFLSTDSGETWKKILTGLPSDVEFSGLVVNSSNIITATKANNSAIYLSKDSGTSWTAIKENLSPINNLLHFKNEIYCLTEQALLKSIDGFTWEVVKIPVDTGKHNLYKAFANGNCMVISSGMGIISSTNGKKWKIMEDPYRTYNMQISGNTIYLTGCNSSSTPEGGSYRCTGSYLYLLSNNGKEWKQVLLPGSKDMGNSYSRYFGFDHDNIYGISVKTDRKKRSEIKDPDKVQKRIDEIQKEDYKYIVEVWLSANRGKSWKAVEENDPFLSANMEIREALKEIWDWAGYEIKGAKKMAIGYQIGRQEYLKHRQAIEDSWKNAGPVLYEGKYSKVYSSDKYNNQANDRFKEMHNRSDSWIDSNGKLHIK